MKLSDNEQLVLNLLRKDPFVSQQYIANQLSLSRPSVANLISGLQDKGFILGKPYVLREKEYVTCVGGANMDYTFRLDGQMVMYTSNPVMSSVSFGGVVRNIAENLARLDVDVSLMTLVGDDPLGEELLEKTNVLMNTFASEKKEHKSTGGYYSILGEDGQMVVGYADMSINDMMDRSWILAHKKHLFMSQWIVADMNIQKDAIEALLEFSRNEGKNLAIVGVSSPKMKYLPNELDGLTVLICNLDESMSYFQTTETDPFVLLKYWLDKGIEKVVITLGSKGCVYGEKGSLKKANPVLVKAVDVVDTTGAGDAFSAALLHGLMNQKTFAKSIAQASVSASYTIQSKFAVDPNLSVKRINKGDQNNEQ